MKNVAGAVKPNLKKLTRPKQDKIRDDEAIKAQAKENEQKLEVTREELIQSERTIMKTRINALNMAIGNCFQQILVKLKEAQKEKTGQKLKVSNWEMVDRYVNENTFIVIDIEKYMSVPRSFVGVAKRNGTLECDSKAGKDWLNKVRASRYAATLFTDLFNQIPKVVRNFLHLTPFDTPAERQNVEKSTHIGVLAVFLSATYLPPATHARPNYIVCENSFANVEFKRSFEKIMDDYNLSLTNDEPESKIESGRGESKGTVTKSSLPFAASFLINFKKLTDISLEVVEKKLQKLCNSNSPSDTKMTSFDQNSGSLGGSEHQMLVQSLRNIPVVTDVPVLNNSQQQQQPTQTLTTDPMLPPLQIPLNFQQSVSVARQTFSQHPVTLPQSVPFFSHNNSNSNHNNNNNNNVQSTGNFGVLPTLPPLQEINSSQVPDFTRHVVPPPPPSRAHNGLAQPLPHFPSLPSLSPLPPQPMQQPQVAPPQTQNVPVLLTPQQVVVYVPLRTDQLQVQEFIVSDSFRLRFTPEIKWTHEWVGPITETNTQQ